MFLSPGFGLEQMPVRIVITRVTHFGKCGKLNVFKHFFLHYVWRKYLDGNAAVISIY